MNSAILVHPRFEAIWPLAADHVHAIWRRQGDVQFVRLTHDDDRPIEEIVGAPEQITRLVLLGAPITPTCVERFTALREIAFECCDISPEVQTALDARGVQRRRYESEGFWGQTVAEFALALTLCGLRRICQNHHAVLTSHAPWDFTPPDGVGGSGKRGQQFGDDDRFVSGTAAGKRVRIVGMGNIASRYASWMSMLGADVAAWDPFAAEPAFHRSGARRELRQDQLGVDAEIFAPMVPLTDGTRGTRGLITAAHIDALPRGCLIVLVTRAMICDMAALRRRVLADELALAADVFDVEPLPLDDPLLGRHNVVHTPHQAGRTRHANEQWAECLAEQFDPEEAS